MKQGGETSPRAFSQGQRLTLASSSESVTKKAPPRVVSRRSFSIHRGCRSVVATPFTAFTPILTFFPGAATRTCFRGTALTGALRRSNIARLRSLSLFTHPRCGCSLATRATIGARTGSWNSPRIGGSADFRTATAGAAGIRLLPGTRPRSQSGTLRAGNPLRADSLPVVVAEIATRAGIGGTAGIGPGTGNGCAGRTPPRKFLSRRPGAGRACSRSAVTTTVVIIRRSDSGDLPLRSTSAGSS